MTSDHQPNDLSNDTPMIQREGRFLIMPGLATVHSHAFQRALRGRTQRRSTQADTFWSWRGLMFALAERLSPDDMFHIARFAYTELAMSGVTAIGEFHYLHHDWGGHPYADRLTLSEAMIHAAKEAGVRITLIRAAYMRAGNEQTLAPGQQRFIDSNIEQVISDIETLRNRYSQDPMVRIAVAAHSIRAVPLEDIKTLATYARSQQLPFHMHVSEQRRELDECIREYGTTPINLLSENGILDDRFVAIHATHLIDQEISKLGNPQAYIGICRGTERDLGDGTPELHALLEAGGRLCFGVDSYACGDAFEEIRAAELDMRPLAEARHVACESPALLDAATRTGYHAIGFQNEWQQDVIKLNSEDASIVGADTDLLSDAIIFGATPRAVESVEVGGQVIVDNGKHIHYAEALEGFMKTMNSETLFRKN